MEKEANGKLVYTVAECAATLHISKCLCYELIRQKRIPALKLGERRIVIPCAAIEKMLEAAASELGSRNG